MARTDRRRLDEALVARGMVATRSAAKGLIMAGLVEVDGAMCDKAGTPVGDDALVTIKSRPRYVSRGGEKLAGALSEFGVDVRGASVLDVGASTGGFVDCLLQEGALRVIALDVGRGQLDQRVRCDPRVVVMEKVNARHLVQEALPYLPDFVTMDVSFISVSKVLPAVVSCVADEFEGLILIKPQFEAGRAEVGKGGIVRDVQVHRRVLLDLGRVVVEGLDCELRGVSRSVLPGTDGNVEFFFHMSRGGENGLGLDSLEEVIDRVIVARSSGAEESDK